MKIETFEQKIREEILKTFPELSTARGTWFEVTIISTYGFKQMKIVPKVAYANALSSKFGVKVLDSNRWLSHGHNWDAMFSCALAGLKRIHKQGGE